MCVSTWTWQIDRVQFTYAREFALQLYFLFGHLWVRFTDILLVLCRSGTELPAWNLEPSVFLTFSLFGVPKNSLIQTHRY